MIFAKLGISLTEETKNKFKSPKQDMKQAAEYFLKAYKSREEDLEWGVLACHV